MNGTLVAQKLNDGASSDVRSTRSIAVNEAKRQQKASNEYLFSFRTHLSSPDRYSCELVVNCDYIRISGTVLKYIVTKITKVSYLGNSVQNDL